MPQSNGRASSGPTTHRGQLLTQTWICNHLKFGLCCRWILFFATLESSLIAGNNTFDESAFRKNFIDNIGTPFTKDREAFPTIPDPGANPIATARKIYEKWIPELDDGADIEILVVWTMQVIYLKCVFLYKPRIKAIAKGHKYHHWRPLIHWKHNLLLQKFLKCI